jgi:hypothetical protein
VYKATIHCFCIDQTYCYMPVVRLIVVMSALPPAARL